MDAAQLPSALFSLFSQPSGLLSFLFLAFIFTVIQVVVLGSLCEGISRLYHFLRRPSNE